MKICPKCNRTYDATWKVCLNCGVPVVDAVDAELEDIRSQVADARKAMTDLNVRLNRIEYALENRGQEKPKPVSATQENASKKYPSPERTSDPVIPKEEVSVTSSESGTRFRYIWSLPGQKNITGEFICQDIEELKGHIKSLGGILVQILWQTEVSLKSKPEMDKPKASVIREEKPPAWQTVKVIELHRRKRRAQFH